MEKVTFLTPVGRIVSGDVFKGNDKDAEGRPLTIKNGPNAGQPRKEYFIGLAIPKTDAAWPALEKLIKDTARAAFPAMFDASGNCINPKFAFKITDGDSQVPNSNGKKPCDREGYPGHWVLHLSSGFAPKCFARGGEEAITDESMIRRGYYVRVFGSVRGNGSQQQPGVFLNHSMVELVGYGVEIVVGPSAASVFGEAAPAALPAGASATPLAPATSPAPAADPLTTPAPAHDFVNGPATEQKLLLPDGDAKTKSELLALGWPEAAIATLGPATF